MAYGIVNVGQPEQETSNFVTTDQVGVPGELPPLMHPGSSRLPKGRIAPAIQRPRLTTSFPKPWTHITHPSRRTRI